MYCSVEQAGWAGEDPSTPPWWNYALIANGGLGSSSQQSVFREDLMSRPEQEKQVDRV
jgi:hypothetical protein